MSDLLSPDELKSILKAFDAEAEVDVQTRPIEMSASNGILEPTQKVSAFLESQQNKLITVVESRLSSLLKEEVRVPSAFFQYRMLSELKKENRFQSDFFIRYDMQGWESAVLLTQDSHLVFSAVQHLLGGSVSLQDHQMGLTQLEWPIAELLSVELIKGFCLSWSELADMVPQARGRWEQFDQVVPPWEDQKLVLMGMELLFGRTSGLVHFLFPLRILKLTQAVLFEPDTDEALQEESALDQLPLSLEATIGSTTVTRAELLQMEEGDVIKMDQSLSEPIAVIIGGKKKFLAQPGTIKNHRAIRILKRTT